jgi:hypothetical protein
MYSISDYSYDNAKKLGVKIKPSTKKGKKIDVFKGGHKVASIGSIGYKDYNTYLETDRKLADERRRLYKIRHQADRMKKGTAGFFADKILW